MGLSIDYTVREAKKILFSLILSEIVLAVTYLVVHVFWPSVHWGPIRELVDLDEEISFPTWFSAVQLFVVGCMLYIASRNNMRKQHISSSFLIFLCLIFFYLSADESAAIHEKITLMAKTLGISFLMMKGSHGAWIAIYAILAIIILMLTAHHFRRLWKHFRHPAQIALSGVIVFLTGGIFFEMLSYLFLRSGDTQILYKLEVAIEEFLELCGVSIILYAVLILSLAISIEVDASASEGPP